MTTAGLYRVMAKDGLQLRTVNTKNGEKEVLNLKVVLYWTPDGKASPWHDLTLWGDQATKHLDIIGHNQTVYINGDLEFESYDQTVTLQDGTEKTISRITPSFRRINDFRVVNVVKPTSSEDYSAQDDTIATKAAKAAKSVKVDEKDDVPF